MTLQEKHEIDYRSIEPTFQHRQKTASRNLFSYTLAIILLLTILVYQPFYALTTFDALKSWNCRPIDVLSKEATTLALRISSSPGVPTSPFQYGLMFEDINRSGDGGLYAELIMNRAFQANSLDQATIDPWFSVGGTCLTLDDHDPLSSALPHHINVAAPPDFRGHVGFANPGYWGIDVAPQKYTGSFYVMGTYDSDISIRLSSNLTSQTWASTQVSVKSSKSKWTRIHYTLVPTESAPNSNNTLVITFDPVRASDGSLNFNLISLFPPTYKNRQNGMRKDLMEPLAELSGSFLRFPGGNNIEGNGLARGSPRWMWNQTLGPIVQRPGRPGTWGYHNTDGMGLHEYFAWCEDLDLEPVYVVWDGLYLDHTIVAEKDLQPYIEEALNTIEYIIGDETTHFGAMRVANGRKEPWKLKYVEIGNEDHLNEGSATYIEYRYPLFAAALKHAYPSITIFASFTDLPQKPGECNDFHHYGNPDDFVSRYTQFDNASPLNPTMIGEYASVVDNFAPDYHVHMNPHPTWMGSVAEAVFLLGLEINADKIFGAAFAPALKNVNEWQWGCNLIDFQADTSKTVLSTSWHVLKLFSNTRFTQTRKVEASHAPGPVYWAAGINEGTGSFVLKLASYNTTGRAPVDMQVMFLGLKEGVRANLTLLTADDKLAYAEIGKNPVHAVSRELVADARGSYKFEIPDLAVAVLATQSIEQKGTTGATTNYAGFGGYGGCKGGKERSSRGNGC